VEGGNITRTVLCQLEDQIGADGAMFKPYTPEQIQSINTMLDRLMADTYTPEGALRPEMLLDTSWIERDVRRWCQQKGKEALQTGSSALDVFRKRSSVSAYRIMALCYYLYCLESDDKQQAQRRCRKIYNFFADYILSDSSGLNVPPVSLSNVPGISESNVPPIAKTNVPGVSL
jgi:hypothetical protein